MEYQEQLIQRYANIMSVYSNEMEFRLKFGISNPIMDKQGIQVDSQVKYETEIILNPATAYSLLEILMKRFNNLNPECIETILRGIKGEEIKSTNVEVSNETKGSVVEMFS
jgi:hypothetical protein